MMKVFVKDKFFYYSNIKYNISLQIFSKLEKINVASTGWKVSTFWTLFTQCGNTLKFFQNYENKQISVHQETPKRDQDIYFY